MRKLALVVVLVVALVAISPAREEQTMSFGYGWSVATNPRAVGFGGALYVGVAEGGAGAAVLELVDGEPVDAHQLSSVDGDDDHVSPAIHIKAANPPLVVYSNHGTDTLLRYRVGTQNIESGFALGSEQSINAGAGNTVTYARVVEHGGDLYVFFRAPRRQWMFVKSTDWGSSWSPPQPLFRNVDEDGNIYLLTALDGDTLRVGLHGHPVLSSDQGIYYAEIDLTSGAITESDGTALGNLDGTGLPIDYTATEQAAAQAVGYSTWLYDISPAGELLWLQYDPNDLAATSEYEWTATPGAWTTEAIVAAGRSWAQPAEDYFGEGQITAAGVLLAYNSGDSWKVSEWSKVGSWSEGTVYADGGAPIVRPWPVLDLDGSVDETVAAVRVDAYNNYDDWASTLRVAAAEGGLNDPMPRNYANASLTTIDGAHPVAADPVAVADGSEWPASDFTAAVWDKSDLKVLKAVLHVAARVGNSLSGVTWNYDGHTDVALVDGDVVALAAIAEDFRFSGVKLTKSSGQPIVANTDIIATWDQEDYDTDGYHDTVTDNTRITIPKDGTYLVGFTVRFSSASSGQRQAYVRIDGTTPSEPAQYQRSGSTGPVVVSATAPLTLAAGQYLEVVTQTSQTSTLDATFATFWAHRVAA